MDNPYAAPETASRPEPSLTGEERKLYRIALAQRAACVSALIGIILFALESTITFAEPGDSTLVLQTMFVINFCIGVILATLLYVRVYKALLGLVFGFLSLIPPIGLLLLLAASLRANRLLKQHGYRVGLFGADLRQFRSER